MPEAPSRPAAEAERLRGVLLSVSAFVTWGAFPLYFKALTSPPLEVLAHRVLWSALFLAGVLRAQGRLGALARALRSRRRVLASLASAALLAINWFVYIWAVSAGRVVDASLGYFITPLVSVLLGVALLGEALRRAQRVAIALAVAGVAWLTLQFGELPWVGLALAATFGSYGALRKTSALGALDGLMLEQLLMLPAAAGYLAWLALTGGRSFTDSGALNITLLVLAGPISSVPLLLFAAGARKLPLSLVGLLQYIAPTLQLLLGVLLWREPFGGVRFVGYALIWLALCIYSAESVLTARRRGAVRASADAAPYRGPP